MPYQWRADNSPPRPRKRSDEIGLQRFGKPQILSLGVFSSERFDAFFVTLCDFLQKNLHMSKKSCTFARFLGTNGIFETEC